MNIEIGSPVRTQDQAEVGHVHRVVVDLEQEAVVSIVVLRGRLLPRDILVPLDFVDAANTDGVTLRLSRSELDHLPNFSYNQVFSPPLTWTLPIPYPGGAILIPISQRQRMSASQEDLTPGMRVHASDGDLGTVDQVELEPETGHLDGFWVRPSGAPAQDVRVPVEWVERIDDAGIFLAGTRDEVQAQLGHESQARDRP